MMVRKLSVVLAMLVAVVFAVTATTSAQDKKTPSVKEIMKKVNGKTGLTAKVGEAAKGEKWDDAAKAAKDLKELAEALGKNKAKKGDAESWAKLSKTYAENAEEIFKAVEAKDAGKTKAALGTFGKACKTCHDAHK